MVFHAAAGLDAQAIAAVQAQVRRRVLRTFVRRALIDQCDAEEMAGWDHGGGFSVDAAVRIEGNDRAGLERLLRYCARPPFALEHLQQRDAEHLVYHCPKPRPDGPRDLVLTPLELIDRIAALVPRPRTHRHRYFGVLAPNAPLRAAVTALAPAAVTAVPLAPTFGSTPRLQHGSSFRIGQSVTHAKFGLGVIVNAEGGGADARVQINFGNAGMKWLALSVAKLEAA